MTNNTPDLPDEIYAKQAMGPCSDNGEVAGVWTSEEQSCLHCPVKYTRADLVTRAAPAHDRSRDADGNPRVLWISKEAIALTLEDTKEGEGVMYVLPEAPAVDYDLIAPVAHYFNGDAEKTKLWFETPNPNLGGVKPIDTPRDRLLKFITEQTEPAVDAGDIELAARDLMSFGVSFMKNGKRIDPSDVYTNLAKTSVDNDDLETAIWYCREDWQYKDGYDALYEHMDIIIKAARATGETTDGYHTLNELYEHRHILFLSVLAANIDRAWRSKLHNDGTMFDGWFIAGLKTVMGQATYHLPIRMWSLFHLIPELEKAPPFDGHTAEDTLKRLRDDAYFKHRLKK